MSRVSDDIKPGPPSAPEDIRAYETRPASVGLERREKNGLLCVTFGGIWKLGGTVPHLDQALQAVRDARTERLVLHTADLGTWDSTLPAAVTRLVGEAEGRNIPCDLDGLSEGLRNLVRLALAVPRNREAQRKTHRERFLARLGGTVLLFPKQAAAVLEFLGELVLSFGRLLTLRSAISRRTVWLCIQEAGAESLPIVSLISLLVGLILAFVGVVQLGMFGAEIYISSLVAIGMTRIMGAIMTGIILAGRIGASYAAVIGTMQVNEEIDALVTAGIPPSDYLAMPRLIALSLMTPLLVLYSDFMGMLGGFLVGVLMLGLDPMEYFTFTRKGFGLNNLWVGVAHGFVFGIVVAVTGCYQGLNCGRNAAAVGTATTAAVVYSIVGIVLSTAVLTVLCNILNI